MNESRWKSIWEKRIANTEILQGSDIKNIIIELKRCNGFDVIGDGLTYESILEQYNKIKENLSLTLENELVPITSVYEVGEGSGANLFMFEQDGIRCGGIDYSESLVEISRHVLHSKDLECNEAIRMNILPEYDAVLSNSVFSYFPNEDYALAVLEKMFLKAKRSIGIIDIHDKGKESEFIEYRKKHVENYEEKYKGLPKYFYSKKFFVDFAEGHGMDIKFVESDMPGYWNNEFVFNCFLYK
ncbi:hypothetical protein IMSAGC020_01330 [Lachnospiraceae bacterium]|nr:hypothetical protein IMSAGC020_01330 [Lachnospiraceae bacterium]